MSDANSADETTAHVTRENTREQGSVTDLEEHRAKLIERMEAERAFVAPLVLLPVRCMCGSATFASDGLCPECRKVTS